jgi:hypothetical protein
LALAKAKVPDFDHLMRFAPMGRQLRDPETHEFKGILGIAFHVWPKDRGGLSTTWVEHYGPKCHATYGLAASKFRDSLGSKKLPIQGYFAIGQVKQAKEAFIARGKKIRVVHAPDGPNTGHVELRSFSDKDQELLEILAEEVFTEHVAVASLNLT